MKFKANAPTTAPLTPRGEAQMKYNRSRVNLLIVLIFTAVNLFSLTFGNTYFLFSATLPMLFPATAAEMAADPAYMAEMGLAAEDVSIFIAVGLVIGLLMTVPYLLCWIFSKKRVGWMVAALVLFSLDTLFLLLALDLSMIVDLLIHGWVLFYLITGVANGFKLKNLPEDEGATEYDLGVHEEPPVDFGTEISDENYGVFDPNDFSYDDSAENAAVAPAEDPAETYVATEDKE